MVRVTSMESMANEVSMGMQMKLMDFCMGMDMARGYENKQITQFEPNEPAGSK